ncbi:MAG: hypothetical protein AAF170_01540 [Bacteroidota bacterium]
MKPLAYVFLLLLPFAFGCASVADRMVRGVERGTERAAEREASRQADNAVTSVMRGAENAVACIMTDEACIETAQRNGHPVEVRDENGNVVRQYPAPSSDVNANYDYVEGERVLFYEDYTSDPLGNFPSSLEFVDGNWEIAEWQGRRLLRHTGPRGAALRILLPDELPERFTLETEIYFPLSAQRFFLFTEPPRGSWSSVDFNYFKIGGSHGSGVEANSGSGLSSSTNPDDRVHDSLIPFRIMVHGEYAKTYVGHNRTANIPNAFLPRSRALHLMNPYNSSEENPMYLGPIRIAEIDDEG